MFQGSSRQTLSKLTHHMESFHLSHVRLGKSPEKTFEKEKPLQKKRPIGFFHYQRSQLVRGGVWDGEGQFRHILEGNLTNLLSVPF